MKRLLVGGVVVALFAVWLLGGEGLPEGKYRKRAKPKTIEKWNRNYRTKKDLVPGAPEPPESSAEALDFSGVYRFGKYDYTLVIKQKGNQVTFQSGGVDVQDIGGAFETVGAGAVRNGRIHARWWCVDLTRNYANNGGAEMWFHKGDRDRIYVTYYHDADERIEDGYGVRIGTHEGEMQHYRIRMKHPVKTYRRGLVLRGTVRTRDGRPIEDAVVMLRHKEETAVRTDRDGRWSIKVRKLPTVQMVSAAAPGYRIVVDAILRHQVRELDFVLDASPYSDDPRYEFIEPFRSTKRKLWNCGNCHKNSYAEWKQSRHAVTATNEITVAVYERDFLPALRKGDATGDPGLCAACHAPSASLDGRSVRLSEVKGVARFGNHCDFCHKVHHVEDLEAAGVRGALMLGRPSPDDPVPGPIKRVYGPLADSDYLFMGPAYNPFFTTSALCAGCHQYTSFNDIPAINTYTEWRVWASKRERHESCQSCHMTTGTSMEGKKIAKRIAVNALRRPEEQIHDHSFYGRILMAEAVKLEADVSVVGDEIRVTSRVIADRVGHKVPTGSADKHMLLVVVAIDDERAPYPLVTGPRVPGHAGGLGNPLELSGAALDKRIEAGDLAGMPGREFAQVLVDKHGHTHVPFWRAVRLKEDTRLNPGETVTVQHTFKRMGKRPVRIRVELYHRLRFKRHDVAANVKGIGVRPLDLLVLEKFLEAK